MVLGPELEVLVPGSWYQHLVTKILVPRSWYQDPGTEILVPRSWYRDRGSGHAAGRGANVCLGPVRHLYGHGLFVLYLTPRPLYKGLVESNYEGSLNQVRSSRLRKIPKYCVKRVKLIFSTNMRFSFDGQTKILRPQSASIDSAPALSHLQLFTTHRPTPFRTHPLICALRPS